MTMKQRFVDESCDLDTSAMFFLPGQLFSDAQNFLHHKTVSMEEVRKN